MKHKKITLLAYLLITSHIFAWSPSGWVYQTGDYQYEFKSGDWYWKMNWDYWNVNLSSGEWTNSSANGWNYYTWPYFYSTSLGQWHFASDPGSGADIVNLSTGYWSKFGQEIQFAPGAIEEGIVFNGTDSISFTLKDNEFIGFEKNLNSVHVGSFSYSKTTANSATAVYTFTSVELESTGRSRVIDTPSTRTAVLTFDSPSTFTTEMGEDGMIAPSEDIAYNVIVGKSAVFNSYDIVNSGAVTLDFNNISNGTATFNMNGTSAPLTYTYEQKGPRESSIIANVAEGTYIVRLDLYFLTSTNGYYYGPIEGEGSGDEVGSSGYDWGTFTIN